MSTVTPRDGALDDRWPLDWMACLSLFLETDGFAHLLFGLLTRPLPSFRSFCICGRFTVVHCPAFDRETKLWLPRLFVFSRLGPLGSERQRLRPFRNSLTIWRKCAADKIPARILTQFCVEAFLHYTFCSNAAKMGKTVQ